MRNASTLSDLEVRVEFSSKTHSAAAQELEVPERLPEEIDPDIPRKYFTLTASDLEQVEQCRGPINRLGLGNPERATSI
jgi:hypothetical protein